MMATLTSYPPIIGCYVDSGRGIYAVDAIVALAKAHGFEAKGCEDGECIRCVHGQHTAGDGSYTEWANCEFANEVEDEATEYMNATLSIDGCYWGRSESGDWGLWPTDDEDEGGQE